MGLVIDAEDFTGFYKISQKCKNELNDFIDEFERDQLEDLLGCDLAQLFIDDLSFQKIPQSQRFTVIFNELCFEDECDQWKSQGIKKLLLGAIYYLFAGDVSVKVTDSGLVKPDVSTSKKANFFEKSGHIERRWNRSVVSYQAIQQYIKQNASTYPEYNGQVREGSFFGGAI